ncbi:hypothetical protein U27_01677 [Candidatus Vecturithrix granuli]|uniref:Ice-binding protein C-terminal domain-containing protein n=1 Tax=Vecturithrix granuli TaxID=1499967 RepID=A0A0S6WB09_VECG1|nr:hypothetical protein U27_01677 [Candidatus Vecturithrix granuli]
MYIEAKIMKALANTHNRFPIIVIGVVLLLAPFSVAYAASYSQDLTFETSDQSMWSSGSSFIIDYSKFWPFFEWNVNPDPVGGFVGGKVTIVPAGCAPWWLGGGCWDAVTIDTTTGAEVDTATDGEIGLEFGFKLDSGSVNVSYPVNVELIYPENVQPGETFTISSQYSVNPAAFFTTNFPELQTYADLIFDVYASIQAELCAAGACTSGGVTLDVNKALEIFAFNRDGNGQLSLFGEVYADLEEGVEIPLGIEVEDVGTVDLGTMTVWMPDIDTTGSLTGGDTLSSTGSDDAFYVGLDVDSIATTLMGLPSLEGSAWVIDYNILDVILGPDFDIEQAFSFNPNLTISLDLGTGEVVEFPFGGSVEIMMPYEDLNITPTFSIARNTFNSETDLGIGLAGSIAMLDASLPDFDLSIGPLFKKEFETGSLLSLELWHKNFSLLGFQDFQTATFTVEVMPEPGTLILLGLGLAGLGFLRRKKRS